MNSGVYENKKFEGTEFLNKTVSDCEFVDCTFENATFERAIFKNTSFIRCKFIKSLLVSIHGVSSTISELEFEKSSITSVDWTELKNGNTVYFEPFKSFKNTCLKYNTFNEMNFRKFNFTGADILSSNFIKCDLSESIFKDCSLKNTIFTGCNLKKADFRDSKGYQMELSTNILKGAKFSYPEVMGLLSELEIEIE